MWGRAERESFTVVELNPLTTARNLLSSERYFKTWAHRYSQRNQLINQAYERSKPREKLSSAATYLLNKCPCFALDLLNRALDLIHQAGSVLGRSLCGKPED